MSEKNDEIIIKFDDDKIPEPIETDSKGEELINYLNEVRKNIPDKYNHGLALDYLADNKTDLIFSITTRGDGKTFNYLYLLAKLAEKFEFQTIILVRHMEVRNAMLAQLQDVYNTFDDLTYSELHLELQPDYVEVQYKGKTCFIVCDLNNANDLKNFSAVLRKANLTLYDEFLAVGGEYTNNEFAKFKTIFETMDRAETPAMEYTNHRRKAIFLGNPVDFSSEFLSVWNLFHMLEIQPMNTIQRHKNVVLERRRNEVPHETKNSRIFDGVGENESITGNFKVNSYHIKEPDTTKPKITVKLFDKYLNIYLEDTPVLEVTAYEDDYSFNTELEDNTDKSQFIKDSFYNDSGKRAFSKGRYNFANQFSKSFILENYPNLNIKRIIKKSGKLEQDVLPTEQIFNESSKDALKKRLLREYLL